MDTLIHTGYALKNNLAIFLTAEHAQYLPSNISMSKNFSQSTFAQLF